MGLGNDGSDACEGSRIEYHIAFENFGDAPAQDICITDRLQLDPDVFDFSFCSFQFTKIILPNFQ